jgi:hypothetical protein
MMKRYFRALKHKAVVPDKERLKKELINQLHIDIELGVKSPNYYDLGVGHEQAEKARLMRKFKNMAPGIRGGEKVGTNKVLHIGPDEHHAEIQFELKPCHHPHEIKGRGDQVMVQLGDSKTGHNQSFLSSGNQVTPAYPDRRASVGFTDDATKVHEGCGLRPPKPTHGRDGTNSRVSASRSSIHSIHQTN